MSVDMTNLTEDDIARLAKSVTKKFHRASYPAISPTRPELSTKGKSAIVTGAGSGIGASVALSLARSGVSSLALIGRTEKTLLQTKQIIETISPTPRVFTYSLDITDEPAVFNALRSFSTSVGKKIDILVANAGYMSDLQSIVDSDSADWWRGFEVNIKGNFNLLRAFVPVAVEKGGVVIHVCSSVIHIPYLPGYSSYQGSKIGAYKVFEYFYHEHPELRTIQIHPGLILGTPMAGKFEDTLVGYPSDDVSLPGDYVNWLVSDEAKFLNGKFVAANWDVEELLQRKEAIEADENLYTLNLVGWL